MQFKKSLKDATSTGGPSMLPRQTRRVSAAVYAVAGGLAMVGSAVTSSATLLTWDSSGANPTNPVDGSGNWDNTSLLWSNKTTDVAFSSTTPDSAIFGNGGTGGIVTITPASITAGTVTFKTLSSGSYTISGNTLNVSAITLSSGTNSSFTNTIAFSSNLQLMGGTAAAPGTLTALGTLQTTGFVYLNTGAVLSTAQSSGTVVGGILTTAGAVNNLRMQGGTFQYTGAANVTIGTQRIYTGGAGYDSSGTGNLTVSNSTFDASGAAPRSIRVLGTGAGVDQIALADVTVAGAVYATSLVKSGSGTWTVSSAGTATGGATVQSGALVVTGTNAFLNSAVNVLNTGTIAGTVSITSQGLTLQTGATASPGAITAGVSAVGTLKAGSIVMNDAVTLAYNLGSANKSGGTNNNDLLTTTSLTIDKDLTLAVTPATGFPTVANGTYVYHLIDYSGALTDNSAGFTGWTVTGLTGAVYSFGLGTDNGVNSIDVTFTTVPTPEPTSIAAIGLGGAALLGRRRRQRSLR